MKNKVKDEIQDERPYKVDWLSKIPPWIIVLLLKYWAAAAAVFFSAIGGIDIGLSFDDPEAANQDIVLIVIIGLTLALFMNYLIRPTVRMMNNRANNVYRYNMINIKGFLSFVLALIYNMLLSIILFFVVYFMGMHGWILNPMGGTNYGIEPFSYALFYIIVDFIFLFIKNVIVDIRVRIKYKKQATEVIEEDV